MKKYLPFAIPALTLALPMGATAAELEISGAVEVEVSSGDSFQDTTSAERNTDSSGVALATVELGFNAQINDKVSASVLLLHEDGDTDPPEIDEGFISIDMGNGLSLDTGRMYAPFGVYETNMVSDPLTLELGETQITAVKLNYENKGVYGSVYVFNGDTIEASTDTTGDDTMEHNGLSVGYLWETEQYSLDVGLDYINSIGNSGGIIESLPGSTVNDGGPGKVQSYVSGTVFHWIYNRENINFIVEYLQADKFDTADNILFKGKGAEPSALNVELGYSLNWGTVAASYQTTEEALTLGQPETRILVGASMDIAENTSLGLEYLKDEDYSVADGGTGKDASTITAQLAVSF